MSAEQLLFSGHTHAKILVKPITAQIGLLAAHIALLKYLPSDIFGLDVSGWLPWLLHGLLFVGELWYAIIPALQWWFSKFEVTNRRVRMRWGVLHKHSREIHLDRITQINEERGIIDRIFGAGTIIIHDAANTAGIRFHDVPNFGYVRDLLDDARHAARFVESAPTQGDGTGAPYPF